MKTNLTIDAAKEARSIQAFLEKTLEKEKISNLVLGLSGGIDSTTALYLAKEAIDPAHIFITHLYYFTPEKKAIQTIIEQAGIPKKNYSLVSIKPPVDTMQRELNITETIPDEKMRLGNIMARIRMIYLYDLAKKHSALVLGTENKSEYHLGYFTRFGDEASDIEPIRHLYKTQVYQLATFLGVPKDVIEKKPTAGLWAQQTDEKEFGFSYIEADQVLSLYFDKQQSLEEITKHFPNAQTIIKRVRTNDFKHHVPYKI